MMKNYREKNVTSQMVSPPLIVSLTPQEADLVTRYMDVFQSFGYEISPFGGKDYAINAVPHNLYGIATEELFIEILDNLEEVREKPLEILKDRLATMSCKKIRRGTGGIAAESERNSPCVNAKLTPASQRGILHCVDTQAITLAWISH